MKSSKRRSAASKGADRLITKKRLMCIAGVGALVTVLSVVVAVTYWDSVKPVPKQRLVKIFLQRGCPCAVPWMEQLEAAGFVVDKYDAGDMHLLRQKKHVPDHLQGCHLGEYLGYFLDGHIPAKALSALSQQRPAARGVGMASDMVVVNAPVDHAPADKDALVIFDHEGRAQLWPAPKDAVPETSTSKAKHRAPL